MPLALVLSTLLLQAPPSPAPSPSASPSPQASARPLILDRLEWAREVDGAEPITAIEVRNDFGDIRARLAGDRRLEASMVVQRLDPAGDKVGFTVERRGATVALVVSYPPGRVRDSDPRPAKDSYDRLDLVLFVPPGVALRAHTLRGQVEVRGLKSDVEAATQDGPVLVRSAGVVQARTDGGEITVQLEAAALAGDGPPHILQTRTGAITVLLPAGADPELRVETTGEVVSNLDLTTFRPGRPTRATSGPRAAGRLLLVNSRTGRVRVERDVP
jgi:hypothetical protein